MFSLALPEASAHTIPPSWKFALSLACRTSFSPGFPPMFLATRAVCSGPLNGRVPQALSFTLSSSHSPSVAPTTTFILITPRVLCPDWHLHVCASTALKPDISQNLPSTRASAAPSVATGPSKPGPCPPFQPQVALPHLMPSSHLSFLCLSCSPS